MLRAASGRSDGCKPEFLKPPGHPWEQLLSLRGPPTYPPPRLPAIPWLRAPNAPLPPAVAGGRAAHMEVWAKLPLEGHQSHRPALCTTPPHPQPHCLPLVGALQGANEGGDLTALLGGPRALLKPSPLTAPLSTHPFPPHWTSHPFLSVLCSTLLAPSGCPLAAAPAPSLFSASSFPSQPKPAPFPECPELCAHLP